jgi:exopolysaccharide biosynthesis polyprenyl glycosylphosphotransferase
MKSNASLLYSVFLVVGDFLALLAAFVVAYILRVTYDPRPLINQIHAVDYVVLFVSVLPMWILVHGMLGLYSQQIYEKRFAEFGRLLMGSFLGILVVIGYDFVSNRSLFPARLVPVYGLFLSLLFLLMFRTMARIIRRQLFAYNIGITNLLIVGNTPLSLELIHDLIDTKSSGYRVVGVVSKREAAHDAYPHLKLFDSFGVAMEKLGLSRIHSILQTELYVDPDKNNEILTTAQENHIAYRFVPGNTELFVGNIQVDLFRSSVPVISVHQTALLGWGRVVKRVFDLAVGGTALIITSPLMLLLAVGVKLTDPTGPVFMRGKQQSRLTRFNQVFKVYKFRSHYAKYDGKTDEEVFRMVGRPELIEEYRKNGDKLDSDFRVTPFGKFLRITSLDELPQLINVVRGDISLVGPRALVPQELAFYEKRHAILSVKSGLTGLAVVSGRRNISFEERRKLDLYYVQNWSFWLDLVIITKTFRALINGRGSK